MEISLKQVNDVMLALNGGNDSDGNPLAIWPGLLGKASTKACHMARAKLILLRECVKPHHTAFVDQASTQTAENAQEVYESLTQTFVTISCSPISWSILEGVDITADELEALLPVLNLEE